MSDSPSSTWQPRSAHLYELFSAYKDQSFLFVEPGGNAGDSLIYRGAEKLAERCGLSYRRTSSAQYMSEDAQEDVVYLHGGGGYVPWWSGKPMGTLAKAIRSRARVVIQGPQTVFDDPAFVEQRILPLLEGRRVPEIHFLAREARSYEVIRRHFPSDIELELDHDTATNLEPQDFPSHESRSYEFHAIRADAEQKRVRSRDWFVLRMDPVASGVDFRKWLKLHAEAGSIVTNRLHSSIAGMIFGKPTTLLPNSYYKNRGVWEYSLQPRGVLWCEDIEVGAINRLISRHRALRWVFGSRTATKLIHARLGIEL